MAMDLLFEDGSFTVVGLASQDGFEHILDPSLVGVDSCTEGALAEPPSGFYMLHIVEQLEGLQGCVATFASGAGLLAIGCVKIDHKRWGGRAFVERVQASSIKGRSSVLLVGSGVRTYESDRFPYIRGLVGFDPFSTLSQVDQAADEQGIVSDLFGIEA